ncbi:MAG: cation-transporting P-type ATPase [Clostridia bacterium]|nr:cation-transporting P-type ATPase [Clostridia bacterium]
MITYSRTEQIKTGGPKNVNSAKKRGLTPEEVEASRREHGENILPQGKRRSFLGRFFSNLKDPVIRILLCALGVNVAFLFREGDVAQTVGIGLSVFIATLISTLSEHGSEKAFSRLQDRTSRSKCRVRRADGIREIPINEVVAGDIVLLGAGEDVPADGVVISGSVGLDMSAMTGENREIVKSPSNDRSTDPSAPSSALRGSFVTSGQAEMEVTSVGGETFLGGISREVQTETRDSPLKVRLAKLARQISHLGYAAAGAVAAAYLFNVIVLDSGGNGELIMLKLRDVKYLFSCLLNALTLALTVIVVAVPEGLPMMIAVVLSSNVKRMVKAGVLVKKPVGIEAAGSMNILFTDKTGTLTEGKMTVTSVITGNAESGNPIHQPPILKKTASDGKCFPGIPLQTFLRKNDRRTDLYRLSCRLNTSAFEGESEKSPSDAGKITKGMKTGRKKAVGGNATDRALLDSVLSYEYTVTSKSQPLTATVIEKIPFDSAKKYSAIALRAEISGHTEEICLYKGAPELLLPHINSDVSGHFDRYSVSRTIGDACRGGARAVIIAAAQTSRLAPEGKIPDGLTFVCAALLRDPPRRTAAPAVSELRGAGIHVVMVTGDSPDTASAIAEECGILGGGIDTVVTSRDIAKMTDDELTGILPRVGVVARALPADKSRLVRVSQAAGLVTGMTGDGINDAPALRAADVGFAMGSGTEVAKDAGDVVILDNDTKSIANSVLYGRTVFKSIRKFITLQLTMNLCAVGVSMIGPFIGVDAPVTVVQMLWINIIMDTLGGLAFAGEPALRSYMEEKPKRRDEPILNRYMVGQIAYLGLFTVGLSLLFLKSPGFISKFRPWEGDVCHLTGFFAFFIFAGVFNCFNARTDRLRILANISKNPTFIAIMTAVLTIQIAFVYLGGSVLRTVPLTAGELAFSMFASLLVFPADLFRKMIRRLRGKGQNDGF